MKRLFLGIVLILISATTANAIQLVSVAGDRVNMRSGPGDDQAILWELGDGYPLQVLDSKGKWYKVSDFEGDVGWIYKSLVNRTPHLIVKKKVVNIRSGPGTSYKLIGKANYGVVFKTLEKGKDGWVKVEHENGLVGWVLRNLLWGW
ncbi:MAG: SH3 domain-containing protein [Desulfobulbaceae bacterium]|nr:SH3 domain-containing protein [Desulfobulbaceae bacterium]